VRRDGWHDLRVEEAPLSGLRVLEVGHFVAAPLAGVLLADQGAEVVRVVRTGRPSWSPPTTAVLARGKRTLRADLEDPAERKRVLALAADCDVVVSNVRPATLERLGLGAEAVGAVNPGAVHVAIPGFGHGDPRRGEGGWDTTISAACGFFTDLSILGSAVGAPPIFTPLPLPSVYAGMHAAVAAVAAVHGRLRTGHGDAVEVPLLDAAMSAAAGFVYAVAGQPARYNTPPVPRRVLHALSLRRAPERLVRPLHAHVVPALMPPVFRTYRCGDGRLLFVCAIDNASQIGKLLSAVGIEREVEALGLRQGDALDVPPTRDNVNAYRGVSWRWLRLDRLLARRFASDGADSWAERLLEAGVPAVRHRTMQEWRRMAVLERSGVLADGLPGAQVDLAGAGVQTPQVRCCGDDGQGWSAPRRYAGPARTGAPAAPLDGLRVLDLGNVIAGPVAARTLAELGADVVHVDPVRPSMGPRQTLLYGLEVNQGKRGVALDLGTDDGRALLRRLLERSDVVIHNALPEQARRLGFAPEQVHDANPRAVVSALTGWSGARGGGWEDRPAYDPVAQAASGIMSRFGGPGTPAVHGIASCIDYFTGFSGAFGALVGLLARERGHERLVARTSLVRTAAWVQLPFLADPGEPEPSGPGVHGRGPFDGLYRVRGRRWIAVAAHPRDRAALAERLDPADLRRALRRRPVAQALALARAHGLDAHEVLAAEDLQARALAGSWPGTPVDPQATSGRVLEVRHPGGTFVVPDATWQRPAHAPRLRLSHAPRPGEHTREVLAELGLPDAELDRLERDRLVATRWFAGPAYLPD
jgi:crotonobetainyl-CoA:carnitine CoA-transferase CaiB-like acyl-CoA transferase